MDITKGEAQLALDLWGEEAQTRMMIEEVGEFLQAWNKYNRGHITKEEYVSEIADVCIMSQQLVYIYEDVFDEVYPKKLAKFRNKLMRYTQDEVKVQLEKVLKEESPELYEQMIKDKK